MKYHFMLKELVLFNMIFSSYDIIQTTIDKSKPYIDVAHKQIICRLPIHRNFVIAKRFNTLDGYYDYYIIHTEENIENSKSIAVDLFGRYKFYIGSIWKELNIRNDKDFNIKLTLVENDDTTNVYRIDF